MKIQSSSIFGANFYPQILAEVKFGLNYKIPTKWAKNFKGDPKIAPRNPPTLKNTKNVKGYKIVIIITLNKTEPKINID